MKKSLDTIFYLSKMLSKRFEMDEFLESIARYVIEAVSAQYCKVALYDQITNEIYYTREKCYDCEEGVLDFSRISGTLETVNLCKDLEQVIRYHTEFEQGIPPRANISPKVSSLVAYPMQSGGHLSGVIEIVNKQKGGKFTEKDFKTLGIISTMASMQIEYYRTFEDSDVKDQLSEIGQGIANSAHGLKNLLHNMDGGSFIVEKGVSHMDMEKVNKGWDILKRNSQRIRELVLDILLFSHPKEPDFKPTDVNRICHEVKELLKKEADEENTKVELLLDTKLSCYRVDQKGIHRCVLNLVSNALSACKKNDDGLITIETSLDEEGNLKIKISDNGDGISRENLDHIYDIFFTTKGSKGTGLGLSVTKKIVNEHNGTIEVTSEPGMGTTFIIMLKKELMCHQPGV